MKSIINWNVVLYSYFPYMLLLNILWIQLQTVKCINCIFNCNTVPYSYFPHVLSLHILYIQLQTVKYINSNIVPYSDFHHIRYYIFCIYSYRMWNVLTVLLTVILFYIHISYMFSYCTRCIYSYRLLNILTVLLNVILSYILISLMSWLKLGVEQFAWRFINIFFPFGRRRNCLKCGRGRSQYLFIRMGIEQGVIVIIAAYRFCERTRVCS